MGGLENLALQLGGPLGTLVLVGFIFKPVIANFFSRLIENQERQLAIQDKNILALQAVSSSMKDHDKRAEERARTILKTVNTEIKGIHAKVDEIGKNNKEYGEALVKFYEHVVGEKRSHSKN